MIGIPLLLHWSKRAGRARWRRSFGSFGAGSYLGSPAQLTNPGNIHIGDFVYIRRGARLDAIVEWQGRTYRPRIEIGPGTVAEERLQVTCLESVSIGSEVLIAANVYITDHSHVFEDRGTPVVRSPLTEPSPTRVGSGSWLGQNSVITAGALLGEHTVVGANAVVLAGDYPAGAVLVGAPARITRIVGQPGVSSQ